jgi:hypothetical protein
MRKLIHNLKVIYFELVGQYLQLFIEKLRYGNRVSGLQAIINEWISDKFKIIKNYEPYSAL